MLTCRNRVLERNLAALRKRYPDFADMLTAVPSGSGYSFEKKGDYVLCRDADGNWLHGPEDPVAAASCEAERLVGKAPGLYVLPRPGLGYDALVLDETIEAGSPGSVLLVVEDRLDLFKAALELTDCTRLFRSPFTVLLLGKPDIVVQAYLERHPTLSLLPITLVTGSGQLDPTECERLRHALEALGTQSTLTAEEELASADVRLSARRDRSGELRVLLSSDDLGYLAGAIADGFRACGCLVELHSGERAVPRDIRAHQRFWKMLRFAPDLLLWANHPELSPFATEAWRAFGVANVLWTMDSPRRLNLGRRVLETIDVHACFDPEYLPAYGPLGARRSDQLSLAAGIRPLRGCAQSDSKWPERRGPDVAFVGSLGDSRVGDLRTSIWADQPEYASFLDELAKHPGDPAMTFEEQTGHAYAGMPCFYVDEVRSSIRRIEILSKIPKSALRIFGGIDWIGEGSSFGPCYAGAVHYGSDLADIYYHARINVNVFHAQCLDSTNSRVYDVLAAGGFLLTEDRPVLHREFEVGRHLVTFASPEEVADKVAYYLDHPVERESIAREGQRHVLEHHTFVKRCARLIDLAQPFMARA